jgi:hypothetical protein
MRQTALVGVLAATLMMTHPARADVLITKAEAEAPPPRNAAVVTRGITRGPGIEQVSPDPDKQVRSPLRLQIKVHIRNTVEIDIGSVKLVYLRLEPIDLTDRIKAHIKSDGIQMERADVPPGLHTLRLDLRDKQGRAASAIIKLDVSGE